jgi:hypothetical protein
MTLIPVWTNYVKIRRRKSAALAGQLQVQTEAVVGSVERSQALAENYILFDSRGMNMHDVADQSVPMQATEHAGDWSNATTSADEEYFCRQRIWQYESPFDPSEPNYLTRFCSTQQVRRYDSVLNQIWRNGDAFTDSLRRAGQRIRAPMVDPIYHYANPQILASPMARPPMAGSNDYG